MRTAASQSERVAQALIDGFVGHIYLFDDPEDKNVQRLLVEYSPTGYVKDTVSYEEVIRVRALHVRPHYNAHTRTVWKIGSSVFVEYSITKK